MTAVDISRTYTIVGGGAIGGTLAFHLARVGHPVHVVDTDVEHVQAIRRSGLTLRGNGRDQRVTVDAATPEHATVPLKRVLLAVKAQATEHVASWLAERLDANGFVVSLQNGLNEEALADVVGHRRTVGAFVNLFADVIEPGVIADGGQGALRIGELDGSISERVERIVADLQAWGPAKTTGNVNGYLWSKLGFGAMLATTALVDAPMAEIINSNRPLMHAITAEVLTVATALGVTLEPFDRFEPAAYLADANPGARERATNRLVAWLRYMPKDRSGIWRDIAVRHRPIEVHEHYRPVVTRAAELGIETPLLATMLASLTEVETGHLAMSETHLTMLEAKL